MAGEDANKQIVQPNSVQDTEILALKSETNTMLNLQIGKGVPGRLYCQVVSDFRTHNLHIAAV